MSSGTLRLVVDVQGWFAPYYDPNPGTLNPGGPGQQSFAHFTDFTIDDRSELHVNEASGGEWLSDADVNIAGVGLNLSAGRNYNSRQAPGTANGAFGPGWTSDAADVKLVAGTGSPATQTLDGPTGTQLLFGVSGSTYVSPTGLRAVLTATTAPVGFKLTFDTSGQVWLFNSTGTLLSQADRDGNTLTYTHTPASGPLTSITDTHGQQLTFTWSGGVVSQIADATGRTWTYGYTGGRLTSYTDPTGSQTSYGYDGTGNLTSITNGAGAVTSMTGDANGRITAVVQHPTPSTEAETDFVYDNGRTEATDDNGNTTTYLYDSVGRVTDVFDAAGNNRTVKYNVDSSVAAYTPATDQGTATIVTNGYDTNGNQTSSTQPTGAVGGAAYPTTGANLYQPTSSTSAQGNTTSYSYGTTNDVMGTTVKNKAGTIVSTQSVQRNAAGQVTSSTDGNGNITTYGYDPGAGTMADPASKKGELDSITYPAPRQPTTFTYDAEHRVSTVTDGNGTVQTLGYDGDDRVVHVDDGGVDPAVTFTYDQAGNLVQRVDGSGTETTTVDGMNRVTAQTLAAGGSTAYTYDGVGNLLSLTDPGGPPLMPTRRSTRSTP